MDFPFYGGSAASPTTWAARPATPFVGQRIRITDLGNKEFYWNGTVWLPMGSAVLAQSGAPSSVTGTTTETTLASITIPGGMMGANGSLRIRTQWSYPSSANIKNLRVAFGGTAFLNTTQTTAVNAWVETVIGNRNALNTQIGISRLLNSGGTTVTGNIAGAVDTSGDKTLTISAILANTGETITLEGYTVEILPA